MPCLVVWDPPDVLSYRISLLEIRHVTSPVAKHCILNISGVIVVAKVLRICMRGSGRSKANKFSSSEDALNPLERE